MKRYLYTIINSETRQFFIAKPSFYPSYSIHSPFRDPFTDDLNKVRLFLNIKKVNELADYLIKDYDNAIGRLEREINQNIRHLTGGEQYWGRHGIAGPGARDRIEEQNRFFDEKIAIIKQERPKSVVGCKLEATCVIV